MKLIDAINSETAPLMAKSALHATLDKISGKPSRPHQAADFVAKNATSGDPQSVLNAIDTFAKTERWMMNIGPEKGPLFKDVFSRLNAEPNILELGAYCGYSSILLASLSGGRVTSIEVSEDYAAAAQRNVTFAGLDDRIDFICGDSNKVIQSLSDVYDLVFLDHWKDLYTRDLKLIESKQLLRHGSIVVADNVGDIFQQEEYLSYVRSRDYYQCENKAATIEYTSVPDAVEISVFTPSA